MHLAYCVIRRFRIRSFCRFREDTVLTFSGEDNNKESEPIARLKFALLALLAREN